MMTNQLPETRSDEQQLEDVIEHKEFVRENCIKLAKWCLEKGDVQMACRLVVEGYTHDIDKLGGIQFKYMRKNAPQSEGLSLAVEEHNKTNAHHPEAAGGIHNMESLQIMVMACDIFSRSQQFGTDVRQWLKDVAMKRYNFTERDQVFIDLNAYLDVLCDRPFATVQEIP